VRLAPAWGRGDDGAGVINDADARRRRWMRRLDHAGIYALIAGTYTPFGLLVLGGAWSVVVLAIVWSGAAAAVALKFLWVEAPTWLSALIGVGLGWVGVLVFPQLLARIGLGPSLLVLAGGLATPPVPSSTRSVGRTPSRRSSATTSSSTPV
jgi:channel protein (hemolysin III family)